MVSRAVMEKIDGLMRRGELAQAEVALKKAIASDPLDPNLPVMMTVVLQQAGKSVQAEFFARQAVKLRPGMGLLHQNLGSILASLGRNEEAAAVLARAMELCPDEPECVVSMGNALSGMSRFASAAALLKEGVARFPQHAALKNNLAHALHAAGRVEEAVPLLREVAELEPDNLRWADGMAAVLNYAPGASAQDLFEAHQRYGRMAERAFGPAKAWDRSAERRKGKSLRVGLISADLRRHAVAFLIEAFLEHADRSRVQVACYFAGAKEDEVSARLRGRAWLWRNVTGLRDADAAGVIERDGIDVLIDLSGHTAGHRLGVMARRPAPVQMTYMGYPNGTGLEAVDYRIVDGVTDPAGSEAHFVEKLIRLEPCFLSYRAPEDAPAVVDGPVLRGGAPVFGAFSTLMKLNTPLIRLWAEVLRAVPGSCILLKHFALREEAVQRDMVSRFVEAGVEAERVLAEPPAPSAQETMRAYGRVDIALDTFPYNGTTTICEASLMGVPVVSLSGGTSASRVGRSLLGAVGLPELCAANEKEFVAIAAGLAGDVGKLRVLRGALRERLMSSAIGNGPAFARRFTDLIEVAWAEWRKGS